MKPSLKYWIFILGMACAIFGIILVSVLGSWLNLTPDEQAIVAGMAEKILPFPLLGASLLFAVIGGLVSLLFRYYIIPILQMAESTRLISLANPEHRIPPKGAREVIHLAGIINSSADAYQKLKLEVDAIIRSSRADLEEERNRFAALMSELPTGVLVCNIDGQILLYNQQAQALLRPVGSGKPSRTIGRGGWIGLGRSAFGILQREPIIHGLALLQQAVMAGEAAPVTRFTLTPSGGSALRVTMAPVFSYRSEQQDGLAGRHQMSGLVLTLEDSAHHAAHHQPGDALAREPVPPPPSPLPPAGHELDLTVELAPHQGPRPVYYEFDLFRQRPPRELGSQPLRKLTCVVFDTETTGLNPAQGDEIIQIGAVRIVNNRILEDEMIDQLIDPQRSIPEVSVSIHGITPAMVAGQPTIGEVLPEFHRFAEGAVLVAHNAAFDMRCLQILEARTGIRFDHPVLDTLLLSSIIHPHQETHSLDGIARLLNLTIVGRHTALGDAIVTAEVLLKLIPLLEAEGVVTLDDALRASNASPFAKISY